MRDGACFYAQIMIFTFFHKVTPAAACRVAASMKTANTHAIGLRLATGWILLAAASFLMARTENATATPIDLKKIETGNVCALQLGLFAAHMGGLGGYYERTLDRCGFGFELLFGASLLKVETDRDISTIQLIPGFRFTYAFSRSQKTEYLVGASVYPKSFGGGLIHWIYWTPFFEVRSRKPSGFNFRLGMASVAIGYAHRF